jgi:pimeloyl-ACP methyl ester carboxylesterase
VKTELIRIETDTTPLDGLWYEPDHREPRGAVQLFHGNTMNFYVGPPRFLPPVLTELGFACLAYNRRGHDVLSNRNSRALEGGAYQTVAEMVDDDERARRWIEERGFAAPILIGHSNGGMLAAFHASHHEDTPALVLLSAHRGGKDLMKTISDRGLMAGDRFDDITAAARSLVSEGRGRELLVVPGWWHVISAATYVEFLDHVPDLLEVALNVRCPTLFLRGDAEPADLYPAEEFARLASGPVDVEVVEHCDHYYVGNEPATADLIGDWLVETLESG